jgi:hypothetical protein
MTSRLGHKELTSANNSALVFVVHAVSDSFLSFTPINCSAGIAVPRHSQLQERSLNLGTVHNNCDTRPG